MTEPPNIRATGWPYKRPIWFHGPSLAIGHQIRP